MSRFSQDLSGYKAVVFDIDGVLSGRTVAMNDRGELIRTTNVHDGYAMRLAARAGIVLGIITGGHGDEIRNRFEPIGVKYIYERCHRKAEKLMELCQTAQIEPSEVIYCGDDLIDIPVAREVLEEMLRARGEWGIVTDLPTF